MPWWKFWKKDEPVRIEREPPRASPAAAKGKQSIPPAVGENFDEIGETLVAFSSDSDLYFELMHESEMLRKSGSYHEAYDLARKGVGLLPHLVDDWIKDLEEFNISSIPMLGFCLSYLSIHDRPTDIDGKMQNWAWWHLLWRPIVHCSFALAISACLILSPTELVCPVRLTAASTVLG